MRFFKLSTKVGFFFLFLSLILLMLGYELGGRIGLFLCFLLSIVFHLVIFKFGESPLLKLFKPVSITGQDAWGINDLLKKYSVILHIETPEFHLIEDDRLFAFSIRFLWRNSVVVMTTGLLKNLKKNEIEAVLAQQACLVLKMTELKYLIVQTIAYTILGVGQILENITHGFAVRRLMAIGRKMNKLESSHWPNTQRGFLIANLSSKLSWLILKTILTEKFYFQVDEMAAALVKERKTLAETLWKLEGFSQTQPVLSPSCTEHFFIVHPAGTNNKKELLLTHPKIDIRIKRLIGYFPI